LPSLLGMLITTVARESNARFSTLGFFMNQLSLGPEYTRTISNLNENSRIFESED
jgi:hypothetical protein